MIINRETGKIGGRTFVEETKLYIIDFFTV